MASSRRFIAGLVRLGLVLLAVGLCVGFIAHRLPGRNRHIRVQTEQTPTDSLAPGDMRLYNADSAVDLVLVGDNILAGLSPKTVAKIKANLNSSADKDTSGLGGSIAQIVKKSVAGAIGTHAVFPVSDIRDIRYENQTLVFDWKDGSKHDLFGSADINGKKASNTFNEVDARRFIDAFHARQKGSF